MTTKTKNTLKKLASDKTKLANEYARELHRSVHQQRCDQTLFCTDGGYLYIAWQPEDSQDLRIHTCRVTDFDIPIGPEYADDPDGYASFDEIPEEMWEGLAEDIRSVATNIG